MKAFSNFLNKTPWWALLAGGLALFIGLAVFVTPFHLMRLEQSGATPEENRAIKREIDSAFSEGAINVASGIVRELLEHTKDPARREELERALNEIDQAREELRSAGENVIRAKREAAEAVTGAVQDATEAIGQAQKATRDAREAAGEAERQRQAEHVAHPEMSSGIAIDLEKGVHIGPGIALPPEKKEEIRKKVSGDLQRIGMGAGLILLFIPLFILTIVSKFFIDRSRAAQRMADLKRKEAEYHRMSQQVTEAKLSALQAQVEPHFLYNTLASVQALTEVDPQQANAMTGHLINYLRNALPKMRESVSTVGQEVELVRAYLNILQMRMGRRLAFAIDVAPELMEIPFPPLMLPSLAENAIKHGLEPQREGGEVVISAASVDGKIVVKVADTGRGFADVPGTGVGLTNIRERLAALYGDAGKLTLVAREPHGVEASIEVPKEGARPQPGLAPPPPPPPPQGAAARTLAAMGTAERAWRKGLSFAVLVLVVLAAVLAGLAIVGVATGFMPVQIGAETVTGPTGALIGAAGIPAAFAVGVLAGLGFFLVGLGIFIPLVILVSLFPVLAPFILLGLGIWWLVRRSKRQDAADEDGGARP